MAEFTADTKDAMFIWAEHMWYDPALQWSKNANPDCFTFKDPMGRKGIWVPFDVFLTISRA
jgi:hypothetical protein